MIEDNKYLVCGLNYVETFPLTDVELKDFVKSLKFTYITNGIGVFRLRPSEHIELMMRFPKNDYIIWDYQFLVDSLKKSDHFKNHFIFNKEYNLQIILSDLRDNNISSGYDYLIASYFSR